MLARCICVSMKSSADSSRKAHMQLLRFTRRTAHHRRQRVLRPCLRQTGRSRSLAASDRPPSRRRRPVPARPASSPTARSGFRPLPPTRSTSSRQAGNYHLQPGLGSATRPAMCPASHAPAAPLRHPRTRPGGPLAVRGNGPAPRGKGNSPSGRPCVEQLPPAAASVRDSGRAPLGRRDSRCGTNTNRRGPEGHYRVGARAGVGLSAYAYLQIANLAIRRESHGAGGELSRGSSPLAIPSSPTGCDRSTTASGAEGSGAEVSDRTGRPAETPEAS